VAVVIVDMAEVWKSLIGTKFGRPEVARFLEGPWSRIGTGWNFMEDPWRRVLGNAGVGATDSVVPPDITMTTIPDDQWLDDLNIISSGARRRMTRNVFAGP
jgi:hypothetical protein